MKHKPVLERTLILLKPDAIERQLTGEILSRFERKGLSIVAANLVTPSEDLAKDHYAEHKGNSEYYSQMWGHLCSGPNLAVVLEGEHAIKAARQLIGSQDPIHGSHVGTIRGDFGIQAPKNLVHGSDAYGSAKREIILWFGQDYVLGGELVQEEIVPGVFFEYDAHDHPISISQAKKQFMLDNGLLVKTPAPKPKKKQVPKIVQSLPTDTPGQWGPPVNKSNSALENSFMELATALGDISLDIPVEQINNAKVVVDPTAEPGTIKFAELKSVKKPTFTYSYGSTLDEPLDPKDVLSILGVTADDELEGAIDLLGEPVGALDE